MGVTWHMNILWDMKTCMSSSNIVDHSNGQYILTNFPLDKMAAIMADDISKCIFLNESDKILI